MTATNINLEKAKSTISTWKNNPHLMPNISDTFEAHIFVGPINPSVEQADKTNSTLTSFFAVPTGWNKNHNTKNHGHTRIRLVLCRQ